jgi:hypothetical protein
MAEIKSAREIAQEKTAGLGEATEEERLRWKYVPEGEKLAVKYLNEALDLDAGLSRFGEKARKYVMKGAEAVLLVNIGLPKNDLATSKNKKAMDALMNFKNDKASLMKVYDNIRHVFNHYNEQGEQQRKQAYESLKAEFSSRLQQAVEQQMGTVGELEISVENLPQFQDEWQRTLAQLDSQYIELLDGYKQELKNIT